MAEFARYTSVAVMVLALSVGSLSSVGANAQEIGSNPSEGEVVWWTTIAQDQSQKIIHAFMERYPAIKASYWRSGSNGLHNKIMTEARVDRHSWDAAHLHSGICFGVKEKAFDCGL